MSELLDFYQNQAKASISSIPWLAQLQLKAQAALSRQGFPARHDEEWKYTPVDALLKQNFISADQSAVEKLVMPTDIPATHKLFIDNGCVENSDALRATLPKGVLILPLAQALRDHTALVQAHLGSILQLEHGFQSLNTAMIHSGVFIYLPAGVTIPEPVALIHRQTKADQAVYLRHLIVAEAGSQAEIIEDYCGAQDTCYLTNCITEIALGAKAQLHYYKIQRESKAAYHLGHLSIRQQEHSLFSHHSLSLGGKLVRSDNSIYLQEKHASCVQNGIYAPGEGQHVDHHTTVFHQVADCRSDQDYKGILAGHSRAVFNGKVIVAKDAQHTNANQQNKNILLSSAAEVNTKPQLEIFADDVLCSHGATVGQLDEEALFYLATRGIDKAEASRYLIQAFAETNLRAIPNRDLAQWMSNLLESVAISLA